MKLYKRVKTDIHYWETWDINEKTGATHTGVLGEKGQYKEIKSGLFSNFRKTIQKEIDKYCADGFQEVEIDEHFTLLIEFSVDKMGNEQDIEKRTRLQDRMNDILGWTGLGHCDGGSIGSGTMEVCCYVIDFKTAKRVIENNLEDTEFSDFIRIYDEEQE
ncbi:MAG: hypothetical protein AB8F78_01975 [Saprospiraceae bacterium]